MAATLNILIGASLAAAQVSAGNPSRGLVGGGGGGGGTQAASGPYANQTWTEREFLLKANGQPVFGEGEMVDIVRWRGPGMDPEDPLDDVWFIYVTGYMTTESGVSVFATHKYKAKLDENGQTQLLASAVYPDPAVAVGTNKAVAMAVDPETGDVYITGESVDQFNPTGQDIVTIKYTKDLDPDWNQVHRFSRGSFTGDDVPADIHLLSDTLLVTGRSRGLTSGDDIVTLLLTTIDGGTSPIWPPNGQGGQGIRIYNGDGLNGAGGDDVPVGVSGVEFVSPETGLGVDVWAFVAGTSLRNRLPLADDTDIVTLAYALDLNNTLLRGVLVSEQLYDRPIPGGGANDVATAMTARTAGDFSPNWLASWVTVCGYTASATPGAHPNDTDYVTLNYRQHDLPDPPNHPDWRWLVPAWSGNGARFVSGPAPSPFSADRALAIAMGEDFAFLPIDTKVWVTGRVREADGATDDIGTVVYDMNDMNTAALRWWMTGQPGADDVGTAIDSHNTDAYVAGWDDRGYERDYVTHKFSFSDPVWPIWSIAFDAQFQVDVAQAIVAFFNNNNEFPIFVTGGSTETTTDKDPFTIRYDQK